LIVVALIKVCEHRAVVVTIKHAIVIVIFIARITRAIFIQIGLPMVCVGGAVVLGIRNAVAV
jgi:hypothetical protein